MKNNVLAKVFISLFLAAIAGFYTEVNSEIFGVPLIRLYALIGQLFLNALTLVVVPLVASSIITGTARIGSDDSFNKLGKKTFGYFMLNGLLAILVGFIVVNLLNPGAGIDVSKIKSTIPLQVVETMAQGDTFSKFAEIFLKLIPSNILAVASQGQMLGLIFFSLVFGYFISKIEPHQSSIVLGFFQGIFQIMMKITQLVMRALPIGVFGLVAKVVAEIGLDAVKPLSFFFLTVVLGIVIHCGIILPLLLKFVGGVNPFRHFQAMEPAILTAFSTSSSAATLPITIDCVEKRAGVSNRICSFAVPLGTTLNAAGTGLYSCVTVFFIAQAYQMSLSMESQFLIVLMAFINSFGMAGVPSASLISLVVILNAVGLPAEGIGLVIAVERFLDMFRTIANVFGNSCSAILIARSEGEKNVLVKAHV